eukprot:jgi/Mesvir1/7853/Mv11788-RA.1
MAGFGMGGGSPSPFGAPSAFGSTPFGSTPTFGAPQTQSAFGSSAATGVWPSATPAFGQQAPAFGATPTPSAFGTPFGQTSSAFGAQTPTPAFGFGAQPSSTPAFGQSSAFGSATPAFGSTTPTPAFGQTTSAFGSATPAFGSTTPAPAFGQSTSPFGSSLTPSMGFGASTSAFGSTPTPAFGAAATTTPAFGSFGSAMGGAVPTGTRSIPFNAFQEAEPSTAGGVAQNNRYMSISAMPQYKSKSPEELRWEDYQGGVKGGSGLPAPASNPFGAAPATSSLFGSTQPTMGMGFGSTQPASNPFGAPAPAFGASPASTFGAPQQTPLFGTTTPSTSTNPFGAPATPAPAFGATPSMGGFGLQNPSSMPSFGTPSSTPSLFGGGGGMFGSTSSTPAFGSAASTPSLFGTASSTPSFGAPASTPSLFGSTAAPASTGFGFGGFGSASSATPASSGGLFGGGGLMAGSTTSAFGSTPLSTGFGGFGAQKPATTPTPFGAPATSSPSPFSFGGASTGTAPAPAFSFGGTTTTPAAPSSTPGPFSFSQTPAPTFGGLGSSTPGLSAGGLFGSTFGAPTTTTPSLFGTPSATTTPQAASTPLPPMSQSQPFGQMPPMPSFAGVSATPGASAGPLSFTPFGNAPLASAAGALKMTASPPAASLLAPRTITPRSSMRVRPRRHTPGGGGYPPSAGGLGSGTTLSSLFSLGGDTDDSPPSSGIARSSLFATQDDPRRLFIRPDAIKPSPVTSAGGQKLGSASGAATAIDAASPSSPLRTRPSAQRGDEAGRPSAPPGWPRGGNDGGGQNGYAGVGGGASRHGGDGGDSPGNSFSLAGRNLDGEASPSLANNADGGGYGPRGDYDDRGGDEGRTRDGRGAGDGFGGFPRPQGSNDASEAPTGRLFGDGTPESAHPNHQRGAGQWPGYGGQKESPGNTAGSGSNATSSSQMVRPQPSPAATAPTEFYTRLCRAVARDGPQEVGRGARLGDNGQNNNRTQKGVSSDERGGFGATSGGRGTAPGRRSSGEVLGDGWQSSTKAAPGGARGGANGTSHRTSPGPQGQSAPDGDIDDYGLPYLDNLEYYTNPPINDLVRMAHRDPGSLGRVADFTVGRRGVGDVRFLGDVDVRGLGNLNQVVQFSPGEVYVYPNAGDRKPPVGQGLNRPAEVTLLGVFCRDKATGKPTNDPGKIEKFTTRLQRTVERDTGGGGKFVKYDPREGTWVFQVEHFSRYGVPDDTDDDDEDEGEEGRPRGGAEGGARGGVPPPRGARGSREFGVQWEGDNGRAAGGRVATGGDVSMEEDEGEEGALAPQGIHGGAAGIRGGGVQSYATNNINNYAKGGMLGSHSDAAVRNLQGVLGVTGADGSMGDGMMYEEDGGVAGEASLASGGNPQDARRERIASMGPGVALTHSLPAQLGLDPQRTHVMRSCLFGGGEPSLGGWDAEDEDDEGNGLGRRRGLGTATPGGGVSGQPGRWVGSRWMPSSGTPVRATGKTRQTTPKQPAGAGGVPGQEGEVAAVVATAPVPGADSVLTRRREDKHGCFRTIPVALSGEVFDDPVSMALLPIVPSATAVGRSGPNAARVGTGMGSSVETMGATVAHMGADAALFLGRSFRVGWDRFGRLWHTDMRVAAGSDTDKSSVTSSTAISNIASNAQSDPAGPTPGASIVVVASSRVTFSRPLIDPLVQKTPPLLQASVQGKMGRAEGSLLVEAASLADGMGGPAARGNLYGTGARGALGGILGAAHEGMIAARAASAPLADVLTEAAELRYAPSLALALVNSGPPAVADEDEGNAGRSGGNSGGGGQGSEEPWYDVMRVQGEVRVVLDPATGGPWDSEQSVRRARLSCNRGDKLRELCEVLGARVGEAEVVAALETRSHGGGATGGHDGGGNHGLGDGAGNGGEPAANGGDYTPRGGHFQPLRDGRSPAEVTMAEESGGDAWVQRDLGTGVVQGSPLGGEADPMVTGGPPMASHPHDDEAATEQERVARRKEELRRRARFSKWLQKYVASDGCPSAQSSTHPNASMTGSTTTSSRGNNPDGTGADGSTSTGAAPPAVDPRLRAILSCLSVRDIEGAVAAALESRDVRLATLLAHAGGTTAGRASVAHQLWIWQSKGYLPAPPQPPGSFEGGLGPDGSFMGATPGTGNGSTSVSDATGNPALGMALTRPPMGSAGSGNPWGIRGPSGSSYNGASNSSNNGPRGADNARVHGIDPLRACLYQVLAGDVAGALAGAVTCAGIKVDWERTLGMYLWYHHGPATELVTSLGEFVRMVGERRVPAPFPHYVTSSDAPSHASADKEGRGQWSHGDDREEPRTPVWRAPGQGTAGQPVSSVGIGMVVRDGIEMMEAGRNWMATGGRAAQGDSSHGHDAGQGEDADHGQSAGDGQGVGQGQGSGQAHQVVRCRDVDLDVVHGPVYDAGFYLMQLFQRCALEASGIVPQEADEMEVEEGHGMGAEAVQAGAAPTGGMSAPSSGGLRAATAAGGGGLSARSLWRRLLRSAAFSPNPLDFQMSWHLLCVLASLGLTQGPPSNPRGLATVPLTLADVNRLHMDFAAQLALLGMPEWAVFVALHVHNDRSWGALREHAVRELLHLSCDSWDVPTSPLAALEWEQAAHAVPPVRPPSPASTDAASRMDKGRFLVKTLGVPLHWLHQSKALWAKYMCDAVLELEHCMRGRLWSRAHELLATKLAPSWFNRGETSRLVDQLLRFYQDPARVREGGSSLGELVAPVNHWSEGGQLYLDYYRLMDNVQPGAECQQFLERVSQAVKTWCPDERAGPDASACRVALSTMARAVVDKRARDLRGSELEGAAHVLSCRPFRPPFKCEDYAISHIQRASVHLFECLERPIRT